MLENFRLRVFRAVAHHLNFSRAAEELLLTQPAVTQQIKALEDELGVPLFDRSGGRIRLTTAGQALLPFAESLKALSDEATEAVAATSGDHSGDLSLGASQTVAQYLLPTFVATFRKLHPRVRVTATSGNTAQILERLIEGQIQLALIEGPERRKDLHIEPFMQDEMVLVVPAAHSWAGQEVSLTALAAQPLLLREHGSGSRRIVEQAFAAHGLKPRDLTISMDFDSTEGLLSAVEASLGVTFVSHWAVRHQLALGTLRLAYPKGLELRRWFSLARSPGPEPKGNVAAFRTLLLTEAPRLQPGAFPG